MSIRDEYILMSRKLKGESLDTLVTVYNQLSVFPIDTLREPKLLSFEYNHSGSPHLPYFQGKTIYRALTDPRRKGIHLHMLKEHGQLVLRSAKAMSTLESIADPIRNDTYQVGLLIYNLAVAQGYNDGISISTMPSEPRADYFETLLQQPYVLPSMANILEDALEKMW